MVETVSPLKATLKAAHQSLTQSRLTVFEALREHAPLTMHELVMHCDGKVDRASVYRTVALFEELGVVQRLSMGWKFKLELSDAFTVHHHHLTCLGCGKIIDLEDADLERRLKRLARDYDFVPRDHQLEIRGYCKECKSES